ncbi:uncharacterized protein BDW43DRAFT_287342 [Aspergillus alliaceus]|uniref:uncharacterized protein n=1 Tax=Petromyces alliaceus TaxID=209559 RepID=UPI0012A64F1B|nr:uncharacterized protein BDW43DRAFT_287342 [Aspergillus alliaceus]KAB8229928.1 hypothetical protein BDW43DRAFT_287342 [Aspergillus alliaceus]
MAHPEQPRSRADFEIAIICALPTEANAVEAAFDKYWDDDGDKYGKFTTDVNEYTTGLISNHNVVLAHMPGMGKKNAANVAANFRSSFPGIKLALLVGICGGVPDGQDSAEIVLGDVIISDGVVEFDFGRRFPGSHFIRKDTSTDNLSPPRAEIRAMLAKLQSQRNKKRLHDKLAVNIDALCPKLGNGGIKYPGTGLDQLYQPAYRHQHHKTGDCEICEGGSICSAAQKASCKQLGCDPTRLVARKRLPVAKNATRAPPPEIHFGRIATGDTVMKSGEDRDIIAKEEGVIAFEMESAGIWETFPCLVIKGVCDYADSHKNKLWQPYAAAAAAACMKALLDLWTVVDKPANSGTTNMERVRPAFLPMPREIEKADCGRSLSFRNIDARHQDISVAHRSTCKWFLETKAFQQWRDHDDLPTNNGVLWIKGKPGAGKSTLMKYTLKQARQAFFKGHVTAAYFFNARGTDLEKTPLGMLRSLVYQLIDQDDDSCNRLLVLFRDKLKKHPQGQWDWRRGELEEYLLLEASRTHKKPIMFLIDALDECGEKEVQKVVSFLEALSIEAVQANADLRICLSSRHYPTVSMRKSLELIVEQMQEHEEDIQTYIRDRLIGRTQEIEDQLLNKASGIFMWVVLVVAMLNQAFSHGKLEAMQTLLKELPPDLEQVFQTLLNRDMANKDETILTLQWILFCKRQIQPVELFSAILVGTTRQHLDPWDTSKINSDTVSRRIIHSSKGLVEQRQGGTTLQFIHLSINDFLLRNQRLRTLDPKLRDNPVGTSHDYLRRCCFAYVMSMKLPIQKDYHVVRRSYPFLPYAAKYIFYHAETAQASGVSQRKFLQALLKQPEMDRILTAFYRLFTDHRCGDVLQILSLDGSIDLVRAFSSCKGFDVNSQHDGYYGSALQAAIAGGHTKMVQLLLDLGADVNAKGGKYGFALQAAAWHGKKEIVRILLRHGANVHAQGGRYGNARRAAEKVGSTSIMKLLDTVDDAKVKPKNAKSSSCVIL